jgi:hypothetical protein
MFAHKYRQNEILNGHKNGVLSFMCQVAMGIFTVLSPVLWVDIGFSAESPRSYLLRCRLNVHMN